MGMEAVFTSFRWQRYGQDRLYVEDLEGREIGWWDLRSDEGHAADPSMLDTLAAAVAEWRSNTPPEVDPPSAATEAE